MVGATIGRPPCCGFACSFSKTIHPAARAVGDAGPYTDDEKRSNKLKFIFQYSKKGPAFAGPSGVEIYFSRQRIMMAQIWARVAVSVGARVVLVIPLMTPSPMAQFMASTA